MLLSKAVHFTMGDLLCFLKVAFVAVSTEVKLGLPSSHVFLWVTEALNNCQAPHGSFCHLVGTEQTYLNVLRRKVLLDVKFIFS